MVILWNRLLVETQVIVTYRHKAMPQPIYYLFPSMHEAEKQMARLRTQDRGILADSVRFKCVQDLFGAAPSRPA